MEAEILSSVTFSLVSHWIGLAQKFVWVFSEQTFVPTQYFWMNNSALGFSFLIYKIKTVAKMMCKDAASVEILSDMRAEC